MKQAKGQYENSSCRIWVWLDITYFHHFDKPPKVNFLYKIRFFLERYFITVFYYIFLLFHLILCVHKKTHPIVNPWRALNVISNRF